MLTTYLRTHQAKPARSRDSFKQKKVYQKATPPMPPQKKPSIFLSGTCFHSISCRSAASCFLKRSILEAWRSTMKHQNLKGWLVASPLKAKNPEKPAGPKKSTQKLGVSCFFFKEKKKAEKKGLHLLHGLVLFGGATFQPRGWPVLFEVYRVNIARWWGRCSPPPPQHLLEVVET